VNERNIFDIRDGDAYRDGTAYSVPGTDCTVVVRVGFCLLGMDIWRNGERDEALTLTIDGMFCASAFNAATLERVGRELQRIAGREST
jgi:hypothetical protein